MSWMSVVRALGLTPVVAWASEVTGRARRQRLEEELARADAEIYRLRSLLADATRPPTQFARMRQREVAVRRLTRLRMAREGHTAPVSTASADR